MKFTFPHEFELREYQKPLWRHIQNGGKRAIAVWHRRAGKDLVLWNLMICEAWKRVGLYYYFLPTYTQGKKIIWDGITIHGKKFIDYIPEECITAQNGQEMKISLANGSIIQIIGTDNYDTIRGTNPIGCVFSEFAFQNPAAWDVVKPILKVNGGWSVFNSTPNGKNDFYDLHEMSKGNDNWFEELLTIDDTGVLGEKDMEEERAEGMTEDMIQQEYYCSFDIGTKGAYYADYVVQARKEGRICGVPIYSNVPVDVYLDLGRNDSTSLIFVQPIGKEIHIPDYYEHNGVGVDHYTKLLRDKGYDYGWINLPHDAAHKRLESNKSIEEQFRDAGFRTKITEQIPVSVGELNGIQQVRKIFTRLWFDKEKTHQLVKAIENYHKEWDEKAKVFRNTPKHDWSSHACFCRHTKILTKCGSKPIIDVKEGDLVFTPLGWSKVLEKEMTGEKTVQDFLSTKVTENHPILTQDGFLPLKELKEVDILWSVSTSLGGRSHVIQIPLISVIKGISHLLRRKMVATGLYTEMSGCSLKGKFQKVGMSITKGITILTTLLRILRYSILPIMLENMSKWVEQRGNNKGGSKWLMREGSQTNGTARKRALPFTVSSASLAGSIESGLNKTVKTVKKSIKHLTLNELSSVALTAKCPCSGSVEVYNLKTDTGMFIANNVIVSNSDALRYLAINFREKRVKRGKADEILDRFSAL